MNDVGTGAGSGSHVVYTKEAAESAKPKASAVRCRGALRGQAHTSYVQYYWQAQRTWILHKTVVGALM